MLEHRGLILVELLMALSLAAMVIAAVVLVLLNATAVAAYQHHRMAMTQTLRHGALFLASEWSGLAPGQGDVVDMGPTHLRYRGTRGVAVVCDVHVDAIVVRADPRFGVRRWVPGRDSLMVFLAADSLGGGARWMTLPLRAGGGSVPCRDGGAGVRLSTTLNPGGGLVLGAPVRVFEVVEIRLYASLGTHWLGVRSLSGGGSTQPALGPLTHRGLELSYLDATGSAAADRFSVAGVRVTLRGRSSRQVSRGARQPRTWTSDSLSFTIAVRQS